MFQDTTYPDRVSCQFVQALSSPPDLDVYMIPHLDAHAKETGLRTCKFSKNVGFQYHDVGLKLEEAPLANLRKKYPNATFQCKETTYHDEKITLQYMNELEVVSKNILEKEKTLEDKTLRNLKVNLINLFKLYLADCNSIVKKRSNKNEKSKDKKALDEIWGKFIGEMD